MSERCLGYELHRWVDAYTRWWDPYSPSSFWYTVTSTISIGCGKHILRWRIGVSLEKSAVARAACGTQPSDADKGPSDSTTSCAYSRGKANFHRNMSAAQHQYPTCIHVESRLSSVPLTRLSTRNQSTVSSSFMNRNTTLFQIGSGHLYFHQQRRSL